MSETRPGEVAPASAPPKSAPATPEAVKSPGSGMSLGAGQYTAKQALTGNLSAPAPAPGEEPNPPTAKELIDHVLIYMGKATLGPPPAA